MTRTAPNLFALAVALMVTTLLLAPALSVPVTGEPVMVELA